ncbi:MAG: alginate export family protein [Bacteroidota bacterium]
MKKVLSISLLVVLSIISLKGFAQESVLEEEEKDYTFKLLRQEDDLSYFQKLEKTNPYQKAKAIALGSMAQLSFGGSLRLQRERFVNETFDSEAEEDNGWFLQRILLHADLTIKNNLKVFAELNSSIAYDREVLTLVDEDQLAVNQLLISYQLDHWLFTIGRENLKVGSRRLIDPREGPNVRRSFDLIKIEYDKDGWQHNLLYGIPVFPEREIFDNDFLHVEESLWGYYIARNFEKLVIPRIDLYYLGFWRDESAYEVGIEDEIRHSIGLRTFRDFGNWGYDNEFVYQFGDFGDNGISAWTISFNAHYQIKKNQRFGLKTEVISGNDQESSNLNTFNPLYPRGAYFGRVARIGPANLIDIHPYWNIQIGKFFIELDYDTFWRNSVDDAVYGPALTIEFSGDSDERFIAHQFGTLFNWEPKPFLTLEFETNYILPGSFLDDIELDDNLFHMVFTADIKF